MLLELMIAAVMIGALVMAADLLFWRVTTKCLMHRWDVTMVLRWHHELTCRRCGKVDEHGHG